jgi:uncharacterized protein
MVTMNFAIYAWILGGFFSAPVSAAFLSDVKCRFECTAKACESNFGKFERCLKACNPSTIKNCKAIGLKKWYPERIQQPVDSKTHGDSSFGDTQFYQKILASRPAIFPPPIPKGEPVIILAVEGGGVRGLIPAMVLAALEKELGGKRTSEIFDVMAGTSAGSIVVSFLNIPDLKNNSLQSMSATQAVQEATKVMREIFHNTAWRKIRTLNLFNKIAIGGAKYSEKPLVMNLFQKARDLKLSHSIKPMILTSYDVTNQKIFNFSTYAAIKNALYDFKIRDAVRASTAAPTFFKPHELQLPTGNISLVDGGVNMLNPELLGYREAKLLYPHRRYVIVSLSTGIYKEKQNIAATGPTAGNPFEILFPTLNAAITGQVDYSQLFSMILTDAEYHRLNVTLGKICYILDDTSPKTVQCLEKAAQDIIQSPQFKRLVFRLKTLLKQRNLAVN